MLFRSEHVFPEWTRPYLLSPDGAWGEHVRKVHRRDEDPAVHRHSAPPATLEIKTVCAPCNNGWMSRLEGACKPYLLSMIEGNGRTYDQGPQELIASWAVKTALVAGSKFNPPSLAGAYADFYTRRKPAPNTRVWIGACNRQRATYLDHRPIKFQIGRASCRERV